MKILVTYRSVTGNSKKNLLTPTNFQDTNQVILLQLDLQSVSITIAAVSVVIGVFMSVLSLRNISRTRQASLFMDFHKQADLEFIETMTEIVMEWNWTNAKDFATK